MLLERVVIGSSLESILFAFLTDSYFIPTCDSGPIFYRQIKNNLFPELREDFSWSRLQLCLSLSGKLLNYEGIEWVKLEGTSIKISSKEGKHKYKFTECTVFEMSKVQVENPILEMREESFVVYDDFQISNLGGKHSWLQPKFCNNNLAKKIHYYISDRVPGAKYVTDCVTESHVTSRNKDSFEFSHSMARFAVEHHLKEIGIKGTFMNYYKNGTAKFRKPKVVHKKRFLFRVDNNIYQDSETVKFKKMSIMEILSAAST